MKLSRRQWVSGLRSIENEVLVELLIEAKSEEAADIAVQILRQISVRTGRKIESLMAFLEKRPPKFTGR